MIGEKFGRLAVIAEAEKRGGRRHMVCECDCGNRKTIDVRSLARGLTKSCGCLQKERAAASSAGRAKHGQSSNETPEYRCWGAIIQRCHNPKHKQFKDYGGRGIAICDAWRGDFSAFFAHVGARPSAKHSLDRKDNSKGYEPGNVRWATQVEQTNNTRQNRIVEIDGIRCTLAEAIRLKGQRSNVVRQRIAIGWSVERALNQPITPSPMRGIKKSDEIKVSRTRSTGRQTVF